MSLYQLCKPELISSNSSDDVIPTTADSEVNLQSLHSIYIYKTQCVSVCLSAIEIKLETFRYKQTYESYITFSREAKYGILISIRIVYGGLRAYIYSTYIKILELSKVFVRYHKQKKICVKEKSKFDGYEQDCTFRNH